jgi:DNA-3-methyladenine glycosylase II
VRFRISARGPLDFDLSCYRYHVWGEDLANSYRDGRFRRVARVEGRHWLYEVRRAFGAPDAVEVRLLAGEEEGPPPADGRLLARLGAEVAWLFSLEDELEAFYRLAETGDPVLHRLCGLLRGYRVTRAPTLFEALVTAISAQQINLPFAFTVRNRLIRAYGTPLSFQGETTFAFPQPAAVAAVAPEALRAMQFSTRKAQYLIGAARSLAEGTISEAELRALTNEDAIARLSRLPGIGRWTAEWALIRALGRQDVVPADDLGVQHAVGRFYHGGTRATASVVRRLAAAWQPWAAYGTYYLLAGLRLPPDA